MDYSIDKTLEHLAEKVDSIAESFKNGNYIPKKWLCTSEVCNYLSISESQLQILKNEGFFPVYKVRGTNYYNRLEIDEAIKNTNQEVLS